MVRDAVLAHLDDVGRTADGFVRVLSVIAENAGKELCDGALSQLEVEDGAVVPSYWNAAIFNSLGSNFCAILRKLGYDEVVADLAAGLSKQIDEFVPIYGEMGDLPPMRFDGDAMALLSLQASLLIPVLESELDKVASELSQFRNKVVAMPMLVATISDSARKVANVGPLVRDYVLSFFRLVADLAYQDAERQAGPLAYEYVGPDDGRKRELCRKIMGSGRTYTREEIAGMGALFGGGFGCRDFWVVAGGRR